MRLSFLAVAALAGTAAVLATTDDLDKLDHTLDTVKDHVDAKLDHFKNKAAAEGLELHAKLEDELDDALAKAIAERREKVEKLQRTPGVLRGVRGNFLDFEGKDPQAALPVGDLKAQYDQVRFMKDHILVLDTSEKQVAFGPASEIKATYPTLQIVDEYDSSKIIIPGFIDTHTHYPQTNIIAAPGDKLEEWLDQFIIPNEAKCDDPAFGENTAEFYLRRMLKAGTTTVVSFATSRPQSVDAFFEVAKRLNLRTSTGLTGWDIVKDEEQPQYGGLNKYYQNTPENFTSTTEELYKKWHKNGRLMYALAPRWQPASTPEFMEAVGKLWAKYQPDGAFLLTHLLETRQEKEVLTQNMFTGNATLGIVAKYNYGPHVTAGAKDMYGVWQAYNISGPRAIMGHTVWASEDEYDRMAVDGSVVSHCPASNSYLGSGLFKTPYVAKVPGIKWTIGNDMGGGNYYNMLKVLGDVYKVGMLMGQNSMSNTTLVNSWEKPTGDYLPYALSGIMAMYLPTAATARALDLYDKLGSFKAGKEADFAVMDMSAKDYVPELERRNVQFGGLPVTDVKTLEISLHGMVNLCDDRCTVATYSGGRKLYDRVLGEMNP